MASKYKVGGPNGIVSGAKSARSGGGRREPKTTTPRQPPANRSPRPQQPVKAQPSNHKQPQPQKIVIVKDQLPEEEPVKQGCTCYKICCCLFIFLLGAAGGAAAFVFLTIDLGPPIKTAAEGLGLKIGTKATWTSRDADGNDYIVVDNVTQYRETLLHEFDSVTINSCYQMFNIHQGAMSPHDPYDFDSCKYMRDFAVSNKLDVRVNCLIWMVPFKYPNFLSILSEGGREAYLLKYVEDVLREMGGTVGTWDILNEAVSNKYGELIRPSHIDPKTIPGIICKIFKKAKEVRDEISPGMQLTYNDYDIHSLDGSMNNNKSEKAYSLISSLAKNDCGIDAVGFQLHLDVHFTQYELLRQNMQRYAKINLAVHITELDVRCGRSVPCKITAEEPWDVHMLKAQADVYSGILQVCLSEPNCQVFHMWDFADGYDDWNQVRPPQNPYIFTNDFKKKQAYYAVRDTLRWYSRESPAVKARLSGSWKNQTVNL